MKKIIFIFLILIISSVYLIACSEDPYIGNYKSPNSTILELKSDNKCTVINNVYKESFYTNGKFVIEDNNITITFDDNEPNYCGVSTLNGKFEGSQIKIEDELNDNYCIYSKE